MSITDELRSVAAKTECANGRCEKLYRGDLDHIADRIDAEHEKSKGCIYYDRERHYCSCHDIDANGYIELPKDADGVPIHVGDVLDGYGKTIEVVELRHGRSGWVLVSRDGNAYVDTFAFTHHASTIEDVLREFYVYAVRGKEAHAEDVDGAVLAEYAAKLRLAEGSE